MSTALTDMRVLIVDDNAANVELLEEILGQAGYTNLVSTQDARSVAHLCAASLPDLILLDLHMPDRSGFEVMADIRELLREPESLPVLVVTADAAHASKRRALSLGARDFISKPLDNAELLLRVRNLLQTRHLQKELRSRNDLLTDAVRARTVELEHARLESLHILAATVEYGDQGSFQHTQRVGRGAALVAQALELSDTTVTMIHDAAPLHDIGKVGVPESVRLKPGKLTDEEFAIMKSHVAIGANILAPASSPVLRAAADIARTHHEHWNGGGYLEGLAGEDIPLAGRITAVADVFDALTHARSYKEAWDIDRALAEVAAQSGRQFDPRVVDAFMTLNPDALLHDVPRHGVLRNDERRAA